jgi:hypothetical protein
MEDITDIVSRVVNADYGHSRHVMPEQPWWENLESNFHRFPDDFEFGTAATMAVAVNSPTPGIFSMRLQLSLCRHSIRIFVSNFFNLNSISTSSS